MEWVEVTGRTVDEAREKALELLGVAEEDTEVEVLAEPKMGLFGRLREEARVRARLLPAVPRSKDDSGRRRRGAARTAKDAAPAVAAPAVAPPAVAAPAPSAPKPSASAAPGPARPRRGRPAAADDGDAVDEPKDGSTMESTMSEDRVDVPVAEQAEVAKRFVEGLLDTLGMDEASADVLLIDDETAEVRVTGGELGLLIGPKGATLLALQDLARTVVQRKTGARTGRLLLDVAGYRQKRKQALERFTQKVAQEVLANGTAAALEPMSSADRKIVHDTANAIEGVTTSSEGEDPHRHVVLHPA